MNHIDLPFASEGEIREVLESVGLIWAMSSTATPVLRFYGRVPRSLRTAVGPADPVPATRWRGSGSAHLPAMRVVVAAVAHRRLITEEVLRAPCDHMRLPRRYIRSATRAAVSFLSAVRGDASNEPLPPSPGFLAGASVGKPTDIARRLGASTTMLAGHIDRTLEDAYGQRSERTDYHQWFFSQNSTAADQLPYRLFA